MVSSEHVPHVSCVVLLGSSHVPHVASVVLSFTLHRAVCPAQVRSLVHLSSQSAKLESRFSRVADFAEASAESLVIEALEALLARSLP